MRQLLITALFLSIQIICFGQQRLQPGFDAKEYIDMLSLFELQLDTGKVSGKLPIVDNYKRVYRSPVGPLKNRWDFWLRDDNVGVINIRGTIADAISWIQNFYAAMVPATGSLKLDDSTLFNYQLSNNPNAMVHVGWLTGMANLAPSIVDQIKSHAAKGVKDYIIMGHSQGGALAFLTRSYLYYLVEKGELPKDLVFKTYCSAAPKPGNLYYAYDFEYITRNGWGYTIVNAYDWVPETPFTVQTLRDFNKLNPFTNAKKGMSNLPLIPRLFLRHKFNKIDKSTRKAQKQLTKNLGSLMYTRIKKAMPGYEKPAFATGMNYMRAGVPIILMPNDSYKAEFSDSTKNVFRHHMLIPYFTLATEYMREAH